MTNFETTLEQDAIDQQVVAETIAELGAYLEAADETEWKEAYHQAGDYIDTLYDEFAPDVPEMVRMTGKVLGAAGLALAERRYGHNEQSPKVYGGSYEDRVLATYHHADHPRMFIRNMFMYAQKVNELESDTYDESAFARFPVIGAFHDLVMGNGRGNDERQSAFLATEVMNRLGFTMVSDEETAAGIFATTWSAERGMQSVSVDQPHLEYQRAAGVADLLALFNETGPYQGICVVIEDMCKRMNGQLFIREADANGFSLNGASIEDCLRFVDTSDVLRAKFATMLAGQVGFFAGFKPADSRLDEMFPGRAANVSFVQELSTHYNSGDMSALDTLHAARDFMRA